MRKTRRLILGRIRVMRRNEDDVISKTYKANVGKRKAPHDRAQTGEVEPAGRTSTIFIHGPNAKHARAVTARQKPRTG